MGDMADYYSEIELQNAMEEFPPLIGESAEAYLELLYRRSKEGQMAVVKRKMPVGTTKKKKGKSEPAPSMELTLPTDRSVPSTALGDYTTLLFGEKKIGKTDLSAQYPSTIHLMFEPGGKAQSIYQVPIRHWREFQGYVKLLEKDKRFKTVVMDTADIAYKYAFEFVAQREGFDHPSDEAYGKGWTAIRDEFSKWILRLLGTGKGVVFISHATEKEIKMRGGDTYDRISPTLATQPRDILEGMVDLWFYYGYDGERRILTIQGSDHVGAGHRLKNNFLYNGRPLREIDMGASAEEGYANLIAAFNNSYTPRRAVVDDAPKKKFTVKRRK